MTGSNELPLPGTEDAADEVATPGGGTATSSDDTSTSSDALRRALLAVRDMRARVALAEQAEHEPIAIVGMGCRVPGASNPDELWTVLRDGVDAVGEIPSDRWDADEYFDPDPTVPGTMISTAGGFIDHVDEFEPQFFGITPREAASMDPQQRVLMEVAWEALESAGIAPSSLAGTRTGTFVGIAPGDYATLGLFGVERGDVDVDAYLGTGSAISIASGRLSFTLGLHGPNVALDTACSSSLVAVHYAVQSLRRREADAAIAGGVNVILRPTVNVFMTKAGALSPTGRCHTFDAAADGYVRSEGCGVVVLKRLSDARAAGDDVLAVILGSAVNHDGRSSGLTVPNGQAQRDVLRRALEDARLEPGAVDYVEAHGTGTPLGDPIEARAIDAVYGRERTEPLWIGSAKTNLGHLETAAGIAGILKLVLSLQHGEIPPHLHFSAPSPHIDWDRMALRVPTDRVSWTGPQRAAGVSSFGFSGTNAHLIIGDPPPVAPDDATARPEPVVVRAGSDTAGEPGSGGPRILTLSARTEVALAELAAEVASALVGPDAPPFADAAYTANTGRNALPHRLAVVAATGEEAAEQLRRHAAGEQNASVTTGHVAVGAAPKVAFLLSGQGTQYAGMGRELYDTNPTFAAALDECDERFRPHLDGRSIRALMHDDDSAGELDDTTYTQPALFAIEYALAAVWAAWGIRPDMVLGHSIGGIVAARLDGVIPVDEAVRLVAARGRLMGMLPEGGAMAAVFADEATVTEAIAGQGDRLAIAAINAPDNIVISGPSADVSAAVARFDAAGIETRSLTTSHAFHSPLMEPALAAFRDVVAEMRFEPPRGNRLVSDSTGALADARVATAEYWVDHIRAPVRYADGVATLHAHGCNTFVEIGPTPALSVLGQRCLPGTDTVWLPSLHRGRPEQRRLLTSVATLWTRGVPVDWAAFDPPGTRRRVRLPTTRFQRERFWLPEPSAGGAVTTGGHPVLGVRRPSADPEVRFDTTVTSQRPSFLADFDFRGDHELVPATHIEAMAAVGVELWGAGTPVRVTDVELHGAPAVGDRPLRCQTSVTPLGRHRARVSVDVRPPDGGAWERIADGVVASTDAADPSIARIDVATLTDGLRPEPLDDIVAESESAGHRLGSRFRSVSASWSDGDRTIVRIDPPHDAHRYSVYPPILTACALLLRRDGVARRLAGVEAIDVRSSAAPAWGVLDVAEGTGTIRLYDADGELTTALTGVVLVDRDATRVPPRAEWFYEVGWQRSDEPARHAALAGSRWLLVGADDSFRHALAEHLTGAGATVDVIDHQADDDAEPGAADEALRAALARLVERQREQPSDIADVVFLPSAGTPATDLAASALARSRQLLALVRTLADVVWDANSSRPPTVWLTTRGAMPVDGAADAPDDAALWGLMKTVAAELPALFGGMIDLEPGRDDADQVGLVADTIAASDDDRWVALRGTDRFVARLRRAEPAPGPLPAVFRSDGTYIVTGAFGALGTATAHWLVERGARHLLLMARSTVPPRSSWRRLADDDAAADRVRTVRALEAAGATVHCAAVDVADDDALGAFLDEFRAADWPPVVGVFHAAGTVDDRSIAQMEPDALDTVFGGKVAGAWNLHRRLADDSLDHFVMFASVSGALGAAGQANYAAANSFLDGLASLRRGQGRPALSVDWGPWDAGMADDEAAVARRRDRGVAAIPVHAGLAVLADLVVSEATQVIVAPITPAQWAAAIGAPLTDELEPADAAEPSTTRDRRGEVLAVPADERPRAVLDLVRSEVGAVAGLLTDDVSPESSLIELGLDSIMIVELANTLSRQLAIGLDPRAIFEEPSVAALAATVHRTIADDEARRRRRDEIARLEEQIASMSPDEVARMLAEKRRTQSTDDGTAPDAS